MGNEEEKVRAMPSKLQFNPNETTTFDAMPHHYQYMHNQSQFGIKSPAIPPTTYPNDIIKQPSPNLNSAFPKISVVAIDQIGSKQNNQNCDDLEYTIMVRACHSVLHRSSSDDAVLRTDDLSILLDSSHYQPRRSSSMSVFKSFNLNDYKRTKSQSMF